MHVPGRCVARAHPHGCGEHKGFPVDALYGPGSSPRVWGTRLTMEPGGTLHGLIPTGVGNTARDYPTRYRNVAHPHGCGEHDCQPASIGACLGSSPRVWGTQPIENVGLTESGLIPTGVGNTRRSWRRLSRRRAHPHGCGEHGTRRLNSPTFLGSSPRVWGTRSITHVAVRSRGLIPTGVGNTR